ncbi:MAG: hypothetical protein AB7R40_19265 [Nitrospiraceae bacterium]
MRIVSFMMMLLLTGCISITDRITPEDRTVKPLTIGRDCFLFLPGLAYGVNTVEKAMANADPPAKKIRSVSIDTSVWLAFGQRCLTVVGEPDPQSVTTSQ